MKVSRKEYKKLPQRFCLYRNPEKNAYGIPLPEIFSKDEGRHTPKTRKIDSLENLSIILINIGFVLSLIPGILMPQILVVTVPMIGVGVICSLLLGHYIKLEYYRLYQLSLMEEQKRRKALFLSWVEDKKSKIKEIKSKPLSEITMED